jgi:Rps23 Pro-64 3,4-dihydroxylase Tpa1-like proline 4-hydroxylase
VIRLNPHLDAAALAGDYARNGRLQIRDLLVPDDAARIRRALADTPFSIAFNEGSAVHRLSPDDAARLSREQVAAMMAGIGRRAADQFQYLYEYDPIFVRYFAQGHPWMPLFEAYEFLNSAPMLDFLRTVTGLRDIRWADAQATCYRAGHFLKSHDDINRQERRLAAYVLNLTPDWPRDWGGFLQFFDEDGNVAQGYRPQMNAINLFTVPAPHSVEMVAMFATAPRLSITGWLRADDPPGAFGRYPQPRG